MSAASPRQRVLDWEKKTRPIAIRPELVRIAGSVDGAYLLSQILYWFGEDETGQTRARVEHDRETWIAKTPAAWATELGYVTPDGEPRAKIIRRVIHNLKAEGLVETVTVPFSGSPTTHIRPCWGALARALSHLPKRSHAQTGKCPNGQVHLPAVGKSSKETETTTETTRRSASDAPKRAPIHVAADAATDAAASRSKSKRAEASEPGPDREPTEQQRYFEAVATACGFDLGLMADTDRANVGKLVGKLRADPDVDLALIADAAARWALRFPGKRPADVAPPSVAQLTTWIGRCKLQRAGRRGLQHGAGSSIPSGWTFTGPDGRPRLKGFSVLQVEGHVPREADPLDPETWPPAYAAARAAMEGAA